MTTMARSRMPSLPIKIGRTKQNSAGASGLPNAPAVYFSFLLFPPLSSMTSLAQSSFL